MHTLTQTDYMSPASPIRPVASPKAAGGYQAWGTSGERRRRDDRWGLGGMSPPQPTRDLGERRELPQRGPGRSSSRKRILTYF